MTIRSNNSTQRRVFKNTALVAFIGIAIGITLFVQQPADAANDKIHTIDEMKKTTYSRYVGETGEITLPSNFRQNWVHLGSWVVSDTKAPGYGFHDVYTQPEAAKAFQKNGTFPDGAVLVKEIREIASGDLTTGHAEWASENAVWFVMVKDTEGRFKENPHWGEGWGWALYEAKNPIKNVSKGYIETCLACHVPAKKTDWIYTQGYPKLKP
jgi:cytochrome c